MPARSTSVSQVVQAPASLVYRALVDPVLVGQWLAPDGMKARVFEFEPHVGGRIRMALDYPEGTGTGKTTADSDAFRGRFVELVPGSRVVQEFEFDSQVPGMQGTMRITWTLEPAPGRQDGAGESVTVTCLCEDIPAGIALKDNAAGTASSLAKLARLFERSS